MEGTRNRILKRKIIYEAFGSFYSGGDIKYFFRGMEKLYDDAGITKVA